MSESEGYDWALNWIRDQSKDEETLYLAESVIGVGLYQQASLPFMVANVMPERAMLLQEWGVYDDIYALEVLHQDAAGNECTPSRYSAVRFCRVFHASLHLEKGSRTLIFSPK